MMYLLDTPVVSELRKAKTGEADAAVLTWAAGIATQNLYISALTLLELEGGVAQTERKDPAQGALLRAWLDEQVLPAFAGRTLSVDAAVVKRRAQLPFGDLRNTNHSLDRDAVLAATALTHSLTLATRRVAAYKHMRVKTFNPWGFAPDTTYAQADDDSADWQQSTKTRPVWLKNLFLRF